MLPPARRWSWTRPWPIPMLFWAATIWSTTGILPEARLSTRRLWNSTPAMPGRTGCNAFDLAMLGGREQEAVAEINRAHQLDPMSAVFSAWDGLIHIKERRFDEAIAVCKKV